MLLNWIMIGGIFFICIWMIIDFIKFEWLKFKEDNVIFSFV